MNTRTSREPLPRARTETSSAVSDVTLRISAFLLALILGLPLWLSTPWALVPAAVFALAVYFAGAAATLTMLLTLAVSYMVVVPPGSPALFLYVAGLHTLFLAMALLSAVPHGTVIPVEALKIMAVKNIPIQALPQALAAVALLAGRTQGPVIVVALGGLALCVLALWLARAYARR
ncbi:hypothetical protein [Arthrobacter roseus]|uniref:hypothetical protein n=1 Tax=Arthrobacter roseus TaxID=136274 RepID=UPI0019630815|nr:hypothetical protein [Arthrobacter roseus]MBM7849037.1 ABC-type multidrug transport system permease subunit [Arthrobacter roseus]